MVEEIDSTRARVERRSAGSNACVTRERADHVRLEDRAHVRHVERGEPAAALTENPGVVDEHVDRPAGEGRSEGRDRRRIRDVQPFDLRADPGQHRGVRGIAHGRDHGIAARDETAGEFEADAAAGSGDDDDGHQACPVTARGA